MDDGNILFLIGGPVLFLYTIYVVINQILKFKQDYKTMTEENKKKARLRLYVIGIFIFISISIILIVV